MPERPAARSSGWAELNEAALAIRAAYAEQQWRTAVGSTTAPRDPGPVPPAADQLPACARQGGPLDPSGAMLQPGWAIRRHRTSGRHRAPESLGRRRTLAVLGAAGIVAGSYALTSLPGESAAPPMPVPVQAPPVPVSEEHWVVRAQATISSLDRQLDLIDRTERLWRHRRPGGPPPPTLEHRRVELTQRRAVLAGQLGTVRSLAHARRELARWEELLRAVGTELAPERGPAPDATAVARERDRRERRRDAQRQVVEALAADVAAVVRAPLPAGGPRTTEITEEVLDQLPDGRPTRTDSGVAAGSRETEPNAGGVAGKRAEDARPPAPGGPGVGSTTGMRGTAGALRPPASGG